MKATTRLVLLAAAAGMSGCTQLPWSKGDAGLPVNPNSPVARDVAYARTHPGPYPKFSEIPKTPKDVPPAAVIRSEVASLNHEQGRLQQQEAALPPPATDTEAFAASAGARAPDQNLAPAPQSAEQSEAYAERLRERATPPPPLK